jgi:NAD-dependent dihydropyrimidine dehydrogenase PreA subunit
MADDLYRRLQQHLDRMPIGFPATDTGIEITLLKRLFSREDAEIALELSAIPDPVRVIHRRLKKRMPRTVLEARLEDMAGRGLIERLDSGRGVKYGKALLAIGIYERQLTRLTPDLQRDFNEYGEQAFGRALHAAATPQLRTVPVHETIPSPRGAATYDDLREVVAESEGPFAVMDCICRRGQDLVGMPCRQTAARETCLTFGQAATEMVRAGAARFIDRDQVLRILADADREGLVLQPQNTRTPLFVCCCCGCCCGVLKSARQLPEPAASFSTNYRADVDAARCEACGTCLTRCQMDAIALDAGTAAIAPQRCIGCGLCVTTCPSGAMALRPLPHRRIPPADTPALYTRIFLERFGKFGAAVAAARHAVGLKV